MMAEAETRLAHQAETGRIDLPGGWSFQPEAASLMSLRNPQGAGMGLWSRKAAESFALSVRGQGAEAADPLADLVSRFSAALLNKLRAAETKYGHGDAWARSDWREDLCQQLSEHVVKGDPRDVAAYAAFAWHHGWTLAGAPRLTLNEWAAKSHRDQGKWWMNPATGELVERNDGELLMLMVSEIAEAMEGIRKNLMDDKLPHRRMVEVEMADLFIRMMDFAGARGLDLDGAVAEKTAFNAVRKDHTFEARLATNGKKF